MTRAYDKSYLADSRNTLGRVFDFAVRNFKYNIDAFNVLFIASGTAKRFEEGDISIIAGKSGAEIVYDITELYSEEKFNRIDPIYSTDRSPEYWTGWAIAHFQWYTNLTFQQITTTVFLSEIVQMYPKYHEMDIRHFIDDLLELYKSRHTEANLKTIREDAGMTQKELSDISGVNVRTIQQYEQRQKNINNAKATTVLSLAHALACHPKLLLELEL